ncbi:MAG TPA: c-type cytochrome domain-containing protein [Cyclobacteriaceae bacterium]|nr:c-type cytochrome domain-containing protein [Cyclobacteriaceae bacterium]
MDKLLLLGGRLHPLLVHLPIGMLLLAFMFELFSLSRRYKKLEIAVQPALLWGALTAIASVTSGYFLSQEGGYEDRLVVLHKNFGIATALFSVLLLFIRYHFTSGFSNKKKRKLMRIILFLPLMILLITTGHLGGSLTHGEEFLTEGTAFNSTDEFINPAIKLNAINNVREAVLYADVIQPIFESNCYPCHSSKKQKGQLRLDGIDLILKGGKHGAVLEPGNADSSTLFARLMLPLENEHHMPPNEKPQLPSAALDLIRLWLNEGGNFDQRVGSFAGADKIIQSIQFLTDDLEKDQWIPSANVPPANEDAIAKLKAAGVLVLPISADKNYLSLSFVNNPAVTREAFEQLPAIKDQVVSLRLSFAPITDKDLSSLSKLGQLQWLYLDHTKITDSSAAKISSLSKLRYLNLVGTNISDRSLTALLTLKDLRKIFLYGTQITSDGIVQFVRQAPEVSVDTGNYRLPVLSSDTLVYKRKG